VVSGTSNCLMAPRGGLKRNIASAVYLIVGMTNDDLARTINAQIEQVEWQIRAHRRVIKRNLDNALVIEIAESELKALETHLSVLKSNLVKLQDA
jgi:hypothetical protein